jgi:lycopene beta-cyclase
MGIGPKTSVAICGAGASGLAVALNLHKSTANTYIHLIDPDFKKTPEKTWCFWDSNVSPGPQYIRKSWNKLSVQTETQVFTETFPDPAYFCIQSSSFRSETLTLLGTDKRFNLIGKTVSKIDPTGCVHLEDTTEINSDVVVDARFTSVDDINFHPDSNTLWQHFKGWTIQTDKAIFDPDHAILMDFRVPQHDGFAFVYLLPFSTHEALVELTYFNKNIPPKDHYDPILANYLLTNWGLSSQDESSETTSYQILSTEFGIIPMSDLPIEGQLSSTYIKTGIIGGLAKPSTGYAFSRSQRHAAHIVQSILDSTQPLPWKSPFRFRFYDMLILFLINDKPSQSVDIFMALFTKNGFKLMFDFLDEKTSFAEELKIMSSVPSYTEFFRAIEATSKKLRLI